VRDDPEVMVWGSELLLLDGEPAGQLSSAAWGESVGAAVGLAYLRDPAGHVVTPDYARSGRYEVNVGGRVVGATVSLRPPYDPSGHRIKPPAAPAPVG
jgi:glycine cleavage system aminomethyltransferase T